MTNPTEMADRHARELAASGLSKDGRAIAALSVSMLADFAITLINSTRETQGDDEAELIVSMFLRQAAETLASAAAELLGPATAPCAGECGVEAHRHLIAISPDGTRIYRERP